jgi:YD repeat-containing protein
LLTVFGAPALAGEERYDYDALGRLVRVIDEQGRVTEYVYDAAGNILQVIVSGAGSAQPPVVTASNVSSIRRGETKAVQITGTGLTGAHVSTPDTGLDISGLQVSATQISFSLTATAAAALGIHTLSIANAGGTTSIQITVNPVLPKLNMAPLPIAVPPSGTGRQFFVTLSSADSIDHVVSLASTNTARVTVSPASVTFTAGQTEKLVTVTGHTAGTAGISLTSPLLASTSVPVFVTAEFTGITTSFAPPVQVIKEQAPGQTSTSFGPFVSPNLGVAKGAYISAVAPNRLGIGTGPTDLVITGAGLAGVTGVTIIPNTGVTLGAVSAAADGTSVSVSITVAANAPTTARTVRLTGANQPYIAARPGADQILVTLPPPQIDSIAPIFATAGTTAATLLIRGRNLQVPESVSFTPGTGIDVSSTPSASADGTSLTVVYTVRSGAPAVAHVVRVHTVGGSSEATATAANTFTVVSEVGPVHTPIASPHVGVVKEDATPTPPQVLSAYAFNVGVVIPPVATGIAPTVGVIGTDVTLTISGVGLAGVNSVQLSPATGVALGAVSANPDGTTVTVPLSIALNAPQSLREVRLFVGATPVIFTNPAANQFRVSAPQAEFDSMTPIVLQVGAPAVTLTITGRNFQNASAVRVEPPGGVTFGAPSVNGAGTQLSVTVSAAAGTAIGPRAVVVTTPAGDSSTTPSAANTLTLGNTIVATVTPVVSPLLGVQFGEAAPPAPQTFGPFVSPDVGVVLEAAPPAPAQETVRGLQLGVAVGAFASGVQVPPLTPTSTGTLVVSGGALTDVTAVQIVPATAIALGELTIAPDGTQVSVPLTLSGAAPGLRGVRVLRGANRVEFVPTGTNTFRVGVGVPHIDSITPILESRNRTFTLLIRGQNFQDASAVRAEPPAGLLIDNVVTPNGAGTELTVRITIAPDAPLGARVIRVFTPGGATSDVAAPANTFTVLE